jgi:hypothetical protein
MIILSNLKLIIGEDIKKYNNTPISLYLDYKNANTYDNEVKYLPTIHALLINQEDLIVQTELLPN